MKATELLCLLTMLSIAALVAVLAAYSFCRELPARDQQRVEEAFKYASKNIVGILAILIPIAFLLLYLTRNSFK